MNAVRTAVTGQPKGPEFFDFLVAIGRKKVVFPASNARQTCFDMGLSQIKKKPGTIMHGLSLFYECPMVNAHGP